MAIALLTLAAVGTACFAASLLLGYAIPESHTLASTSSCPWAARSCS